MQEESDIIQGNNGLLYKAETILRHRNRISEINERKSKQKLESIQIQKQKQRVPKNDVKKPEELVTNYREQQKNFASYKLRKRASTDSIELENGSLVLIIRIRGDKHLSPQQKGIFRKLQLKKQHEAHFFVVSEDLKRLIRSIENFIVYGYVTKATVKSLINKRGYLRIEKEVKPINSNKVVEDTLGSLGMVCIEDVVSEIFNRGQNFEKLKKSVW
jgi:large subunit ribosomal protein L7e